MNQDETDDINHPARKAGRQALSALLHKTIDDWASSQGGTHYVDVAVVLANLLGAVAAQGGILTEPLKEMVDSTFTDTAMELATGDGTRQAALPDGVTKN